MTPVIAMDQTPFLSAENVFKSFGGAGALFSAGITLRKGEIHALVGANGAGKSTLAKIIAGHQKSDQGEILIQGSLVNMQSPRDAIRLGVAMVNQQLSLAPDLSAAENIMLTELCRPDRWRPSRILARAEEVMSALLPPGTIDLRSPVDRLPMAQKQMVEIAKALSQNPEIIFFDEPTTSLTPNEVDRLFDIMHQLVEAGKGLVFVSHRLEEIFTITDLVTVLRDGRNICRSIPTKELDQPALVRLMIGRDLASDIYSRKTGAEQEAISSSSNEVVMKVDHLSAGNLVKDVSFQLHQGEILGLAGLVGAGRTETARAIFGLDPIKGGQIEIYGQPFYPKKPATALERGLALIPEDRRVQGVIPDFLVKENIQLTRMSLKNTFLTGYTAAFENLLSLTRRLSLPDGHLEKPILDLSGGQQQKALVSRLLMVEPKILIVDEPTQGVDVGTRSDIYTLLRELSDIGLSIILISSDFEEILGLSDRVIVLTEGKVAADIPAHLVDEERLLMFATPRTSTDGTNLMLREMASFLPDGTISWIYMDQGLVYCFNQIEDPSRPDPGFRAGQIVPLVETSLKLFEKQLTYWQWIKDGQFSSLVIPLFNAKGHELGLVSVCLSNESPGLAKKEEIETLVARWYKQPAAVNA